MSLKVIDATICAFESAFGFVVVCGRFILSSAREHRQRTPTVKLFQLIIIIITLCGVTVSVAVEMEPTRRANMSSRSKTILLDGNTLSPADLVLLSEVDLPGSLFPAVVASRVVGVPG